MGDKDIADLADLDPEGTFVISTRIRCSRFSACYPFNPLMTESNYRNIESRTREVFDTITDEELKRQYYPLSGLDEATKDQLVEDHFLFKEGDRFLEVTKSNRFWPTGRGNYHNSKRTLTVWVNEENHLRIILMQKGGKSERCSADSSRVRNMGSGPSAHQSSHDMMVDAHQYPDMNVIFRGIPKMMQVADDMHRMTDYIQDLRNMTFVMALISAVGMIGFLIIKFSTRNSRRRKRSILRHAEEGYGHTMPRYYYQSQYAPEPWDRPKSQFSHQSQIEPEKKPIDSRNSPETKPNGNLPYKSHPSFKKTSSQPSSLQTSLEDNFSPELIKKAPLASQDNDRHHSTSRLPHKV